MRSGQTLAAFAGPSRQDDRLFAGIGESAQCFDQMGTIGEALEIEGDRLGGFMIDQVIEEFGGVDVDLIADRDEA